MSKQDTPTTIEKVIIDDNSAYYLQKISSGAWRYEQTFGTTKEAVEGAHNDPDRQYYLVSDCTDVIRLPNGRLEVFYKMLEVKYPDNWMGIIAILPKRSQILSNRLASLISVYNKMGNIFSFGRRFREIKLVDSVEEAVELIQAENSEIDG